MPAGITGMFLWVAAKNLLRTDPVEDKEGFFIALFVRRNAAADRSKTADRPTRNGPSTLVRGKRRMGDGSMNKKEAVVPQVCPKFLKFWRCAQLCRRRNRRFTRRGIEN